MPDCQLRPATADDAPIVYALICELKQAEFDHQAFHAGYLANLQDHNMRYQLAELDGKIIGMIGLHMQFHLHQLLDRRDPGAGGDAAGARIESG
ncbi:aminoalkylphosphonic acid N-acetyltransferase [Enterobacter hormaechei subsp. hoffmannii UCICRE 3]|nr:aminoalkylphosphonic acid N-acetyltransferase [Enterobacter hormaechei subsp. hoffmannii UCICRE 3]